ncbi:metallophosphoesterase [Paenibacillus sabinae]|uniref:Metallophosphoesterase n=1 Tax=Paenibacillus sabinae T27 TaxID=1268072 RepID=X4ZNG4_9BACL|nr:metallophosphoesterase [Paenibacillus sabinae]AHV98742.1 metallophosphoesterase [Paenibacillus sabinae T27]
MNKPAHNKSSAPAPIGGSGNLADSSSTGTGGKKITRRQFLARGAATLIGAGLLTGGYSWQGETRWLDITRMTLSWKQLPSAFSGMKLVHFSDVHLGFNKDVDDVKRLVRHIREAEPDLICFSGDIVDSYPEDLTESVPLLASLTAPMGKFAVLGNHDYKHAEQLVGLLEAAGFKVLRNDHVLIRKGEAAIAVTGMEDYLINSPGPDPKKAMGGIPPGMFTVLLMHEPDYADFVQDYSIQLQLSGHSHGGQIRIPFVGAPFLPDGSTKYISGLYTVGEPNRKLYVNRGFGETYMPFRFMCRPELTVFTLRRTEG